MGRGPWRPGSGGARAGNGTWFLADGCNRSNNPPQNSPESRRTGPPSDDEMNRYDMHGRSLSGCPGALRRRAVTPRSGCRPARLRCATTRTGSGQPAGNRAPLVAPAHPAAVAPPKGYDSEARRSGRAFGVLPVPTGTAKMEIPAGTYSPEVRTSCKSQHHPEPRCQRHTLGGFGDCEPVSRW